MEHFSHEHPLVLNLEVHKIDDGADMAIINCDGCETPISEGPFYSCVGCGYFLHESCAKLPKEIDHPLHLEHTLTLLSTPPSPTNEGRFRCNMCRELWSKFVYNCSECNFGLDTLCAVAQPPIGMKHFSHEHPLFLIPERRKLYDGRFYKCKGCSTLISEGPFYSCVMCIYLMHKACAKLPEKVDHPLHPEHTLTLYKRCPVGQGTYKCSMCRKTRRKFVYFCDECCFPIDTICAQEHNIDNLCAPFAFVKHFIHKHPLTLYPEERKIDDHSQMQITHCWGCCQSISGPFYSCEVCNCDFHKACGEIPNEINHPKHPQHPLTLITDCYLACDLCGESLGGILYHCSICPFYVDIKCASPLPMIADKCHPHPLTARQIPISTHCYICRTKEIGLFYNCNICPFWVHQNCTLIPATVKISYHDHLLTLLPSVPSENLNVRSNCDLCYNRLLWFQCVYGCKSCLFFAHVGCTISESKNPSSRNQNNQQLLPLLQQRSTDLISQFVEKFIDQDGEVGNKIDHFDHEHLLFLIDEQRGEKVCEACAVPISSPLYGCIKCDYFLHKCCAQLPKKIIHPLFSENQHILKHAAHSVQCQLCYQDTNGFFYTILSNGFYIDIKCASLIGPIHHEGHRHPLTPRVTRNITCTACDMEARRDCYLKCDTCNFKLCFRCAMAPPIIYHRFGKKDPFILTYSPPANHYNEYICEICEEELDPKLWYYNCGYCDQFTHISCMLSSGGDYNIVYGKSYLFDDKHKHKLTLVPFVYNYHGCSICKIALNKGFSVGLECIVRK